MIKKTGENVYFCKEVYDLEFYDANDGEFLFGIDKAKDVVISGRKDKWNILTVRDASIDLDVMRNLVNGYYDDVNFKINGKTILRDGNSHKDSDTTIRISLAELVEYTYMHGVGNVVAPEIRFGFTKELTDGILENFPVEVD